MELSIPYSSINNATPKIRRSQYHALTLVAVIYFFFNNFLLPDGMLYTMLLSPVFLYWLLVKKAPVTKAFFYFLLVWGTFLVIHYSYGISLPEYLKSSILYFSVFLFGLTTYAYFKLYSFTYEPLMENILKLNFLFVLGALALLPTEGRDLLWAVNSISEGLSDLPRLKMLTYEPSYYSLLLIPSLFFYFQYVFFRTMTRSKWLLFFSVLISLGCSLSYGAIFISLITMALFVLYNFFSNARRRQNKRFMTLLIIFFVAGVSLLITFFADSTFMLRILNIVDGNDSSINNRSSQAYFLALSIADLKSVIFGVGPGQIKLLGQDLISLVYSYGTDEATGQVATARIPCSMAEMLCNFGWVGFFGKLMAELILFRKTKVKTSSFRLCLFIFMFIYQFVGSYSTSVVEIFFWVLAFSTVFPDSYFRKELPANATIS
jgi:hypothetical protein